MELRVASSDGIRTNGASAGMALDQGALLGEEQEVRVLIASKSSARYFKLFMNRNYFLIILECSRLAVFTVGKVQLVPKVTIITINEGV